jgi:uncharacterized integral membrane protein
MTGDLPPARPADGPGVAGAGPVPPGSGAGPGTGGLDPGDPGTPADRPVLREPARPRTDARALAQHTIDRTRTGGLWVAVTAAAIVILLLLIFVLQNTEQVEVALFGANPNLPLGVALLLAAVLGALVVALIGTARIVQLRQVARRHRDEDRRARR